MKFVDSMFDWFSSIGSTIANGFNNLLDLIMKPLSYLFWFLDGVFYFFMMIFDVAVKLVMIFVALFQFIMALITGLLRTIQDLLTPTFNSADVNLPSNSEQGLQVVLDLVDPTGLLTIIPYICIAFVWSAFIYKILGLFGGNIVVKGGS
jgi:hypothetical protein